MGSWCAGCLRTGGCRGNGLFLGGWGFGNPGGVVCAAAHGEWVGVLGEEGGWFCGRLLLRVLAVAFGRFLTVWVVRRRWLLWFLGEGEGRSRDVGGAFYIDIFGAPVAVHRYE